jgi:hypothetical protein
VVVNIFFWHPPLTIAVKSCNIIANTFFFFFYSVKVLLYWMMIRFQCTMNFKNRVFLIRSNSKLLLLNTLPKLYHQVHEFLFKFIVAKLS